MQTDLHSTLVFPKFGSATHEQGKILCGALSGGPKCDNGRPNNQVGEIMRPWTRDFTKETEAVIA